MSTFFSERVVCWRCERASERMIVHSLSAGRRPEMRQAILEDRFQRFACDGCGATSIVERPFFYFDEPARLWFGVYPSEWETSWQMLERELVVAFDHAMVQFAPPIMRAVACDYRVRAVFGLRALREKLVAFDAGLDDEEVESLKVELMRRGGPLALCPGQRPRLQRVDGDSLVFETVELEVAVPRALLGSTEPRVTDAIRGPAYVDMGRIVIDGVAQPYKSVIDPRSDAVVGPDHPGRRATR